MGNVGSLLERLKDDDATFTAQEVSAMLDFTRERAVHDMYVASKLAQDMQLAREMHERTLALQERFEQMRLEHATQTPYVLKVVTDDDKA